jgi:hypothetical protein
MFCTLLNRAIDAAARDAQGQRRGQRERGAGPRLLKWVHAAGLPSTECLRALEDLLLLQVSAK